MIRFTKNSIIIEIKTTEGDQFGCLHDFQSALINVPALIDYNSAPTEMMEWSLSRIAILLQEFIINRDQLTILNKHLLDSPEKIEEFNKWE